MKEERSTFDFIAELRAIQRAENDDFPSPSDVEALIRATDSLLDTEGKLWSPNALNGLVLLRIDPDEWQEIEDSSRSAFRKLATETMFPSGDFSREALVLGVVRSGGLEGACRETVSSALLEILREGKADFFERLAETVRETRGTSPDEFKWLAPDGTMRDRAAWAMVIGWTRSLFPNSNFPPLALWSYDALTDFFETVFHVEYGREGIRRRVSELGLKLPSVFLVRRLEHTHDGSGFRPILKKRRRPAGTRKRQAGLNVSDESRSGDTI